MTMTLNTMVNGSSGTCTHAADWLKQLAEAAGRTAGAIKSAHSTAEEGWKGPASDAFQLGIQNTDRVADDIVDRAHKYERALRDFASSLDTVTSRMQDALGKARSGGLRVEGPFILPPEPVTRGKPGTPIEICTPDTVHQKIGTYQGDVQEYNAEVSDYNHKVRVFNECKSIIDAARVTESNAHDALRAALKEEGQGVDWMTVGTTTIARVNGYISSFENPRSESLLKAQRFQGYGNFYEAWMNGTKLNLSAADRAALEWARANAHGNQYGYEQKMRQAAKFVEKVPEPVRRIVSAYPGRGALHDLPEGSAGGVKVAQKLLKGMPYLGSTITAGAELWGAYTGEQSWEKAVADAGGLIAGGSLGAAGAGAAYGALVGSAATPLGSFVVGTVGGILGGLGGQAVVDIFVPE